MLQEDTLQLYKDHMTNGEVSMRIQQISGPYEDLLTTVKKRKLKWYGHVRRSTGLAKTMLQGTVPGGRGKGIKRRDGRIISMNRQA